MIDIDRRAFIAGLGGAAVVAGMTPEANASWMTSVALPSVMRWSPVISRRNASAAKK